MSTLPASWIRLPRMKSWKGVRVSESVPSPPACTAAEPKARELTITEHTNTNPQRTRQCWYPFQSVSVKRKPSAVSFRLVSMKQLSVSFICLYKPICLYVGWAHLCIPYKTVICVNKIQILRLLVVTWPHMSRIASWVTRHESFHISYRSRAEKNQCHCWWIRKFYQGENKLTKALNFQTLALYGV